MPQGMKRVFVTKLTETSTEDKESVGTLRREGDKEYIYAKASESIGAGKFGKFGHSASSMYNATLAGKSSVAANIGAAVASLSASDHGWLQIRGPMSNAVAPSAGSRSTSISAGSKLQIVSSAGTVTASASMSTTGLVATGSLGTSASSTNVSVNMTYPMLS